MLSLLSEVVRVLTLLLSPGRFFAVSMLKLMLAYLALEFDMEPFPGDKQPQWMELGGVSLLMDDTYVKMKKRDCSLGRQ